LIETARQFSNLLARRIMNKSFNITLKGAPDEIVAHALEMAHKHGIEFVGDEQAGRFTGHGVEGSYRISGEILSVRIAKKPFILPWSLIESRLRDFFV
jgi:hypothetical protein